MNELQYPIGQFAHDTPVTTDDLHTWTGQIEELPQQMHEAVDPLSDDQLNTPYRPGGWTLRQVVHHVPDSHLNSYIRFKWALTEEEPLIKAYDEQRWAELVDYRVMPIQASVRFLASLHDKWGALLPALSPEQWSRRFRHPESGLVDLRESVGLYAWHGRHHLAHITNTIRRHGWYGNK